MKKFIRKAIASVTLCGMLLSMSESSLAPFSSSYLAEDISADSGIVADDGTQSAASSVQENKASETHQELAGAGLIEEGTDIQGGNAAVLATGSQDTRTELQADVKDTDLHTELSGNIPADASLTAEAFTGTAAMEGLELLQGVKLQVLDMDHSAYTQEADYEISITSTQIRDAIAAGRTLSVYRARKDGSSPEKREDLEVTEENGVKVLRFKNNKIDERPVFLIMQETAPAAQTPQTEAAAQAQESETQAPQTETQVQESETQALQSETQVKESETQAPQTETQVQEFETQAAQTETQVQESETQAPAVAPQTLTAAPKTGESESETEAVSETETETETEAVSEQETEATRREYVYEDDAVKVVATLSDPTAVPDDARFSATQVLPKSQEYNYDAYMEALNTSADPGTGSSEDNEDAVVDDSAVPADSTAYTDNNTKLYDIAFLYDQVQEDGTVKTVEYEPAAGTVQVSMEFKDSQLTENVDTDPADTAEVAVTHLPLDQNIKSSVDKTADATDITASDIQVEPVTQGQVVSAEGTQELNFSTDSFSIYAFKTLVSNKNASGSDNGTYKLGLHVTGAASNTETTNKANVVLVLDLSGSMNFLVKDASGMYGTKNKDGEVYAGGHIYSSSGFQLYKQESYYEYSSISDGYTGEVYRKNGGGYSKYTGDRYSMESRLSVEKAAVNTMADALLGNNKNSSDDMVELSLVTFGEEGKYNIPSSSSADGWIKGNSADSFKTTVNSLRTGNGEDNSGSQAGTNWDDGLHKALALANAKAAVQKNETTYILFVSDGNPTFYYDEAHTVRSGNGRATTDNELNAAYMEADSICDEHYEFYSIGVFGSIDNMQTLATGSNASGKTGNRTGHYIAATDQAGLESAFNALANTITGNLNYQKVAVTDGITGLTSSVVASDVSDFTYTKARIVNQDSGGYYYTDENNAKVYLIAEQESTLTKYTTSNGIYTVFDPQSLENAPASYDKTTSNVSWNLSKISIENGWLYNVEFTVWPGQDAYDTVADLNNGTLTLTVGGTTYSSIDALLEALNNATVNYDSLSDQLKKVIYLGSDGIYVSQIVNNDSGGYSLNTNTPGTNITYDELNKSTSTKLPAGIVINGDSYQYNINGKTINLTENDTSGLWVGETDDGNGKKVKYSFEIQITDGGKQYVLTTTNIGYINIVNPDPVPLADSTMSVKKVWKVDDDTTNIADQVVLNLYIDGEESGTSFTLSKVNDWMKEQVYVAPGLMVTDGDVLTVKDNGHDYSLSESSATKNGQDVSGSYVFSTETIHPMLIDSASNVTYLVKATDEADARSKGTPYEINGKWYYATEGNASSLTGTNTLVPESSSAKMEIRGKKVWSDGNNQHSNDTVTINLMQTVDGGTTTIVSSTTTSATQDWKYSFDISNGEKYPLIDKNGRSIKYTIEEVPVAGYSTVYTQPIISFIPPTADNGWKKISPCSNMNITNNVSGDQSIFACKTTGKIGQLTLIWSVSQLTTAEQSVVKNSLLNEVVTSKMVWVSGAGSFYGGNITVPADLSTISFTDPSVWTLVVSGTYNKSETKTTKTVVFNRQVKVAPEVTKEIEGRNWTDSDTYTFTLSADTGNPIPAEKTATATINKKTASFGSIVFTKPGTYYYTITENVPDDAVNSVGVMYSEATETQKANGGFAKDGIIYDSTSYPVKVVVKENNPNDTDVTNRILAATITYGDSNESDLTITNTFKVNIKLFKADKDVSDGTYLAGGGYNLWKKGLDGSFSEQVSVNDSLVFQAFKSEGQTLSLDAGEYKVVENTAPDGYLLLPTDKANSLTFTVKTDGTISSNDTSGFITVNNDNKTVVIKDTRWLKLTVHKDITGKMADTTASFEFTISLKSDSLTSYIEQIISKNTVEGVAPSISGPDGNGVYTVGFSLTNGREHSIYLPYGTNYTVTETLAGKNGYTTSIKDDHDNEGLNGTIVGELIMDTKIVYENNRPMIAPTELPMLRWRYVMMIAASVLGLAAVFVVFRRRRRLD